MSNGENGNRRIAELEAKNKRFKDALECYATPAEWTAEVFLQGENADGSEWEFVHDLDCEKVFNRDEHGWVVAQDASRKV